MYEDFISYILPVLGTALGTILSALFAYAITYIKKKKDALIKNTDSDLEKKYIEKISDNSVFIMEVSKYEREYPDEVVDEILKAQKVFGEDNLYVVFTDYTKKEQRKIAKERREKDPIIFGALKKDGKVLDRLYYICDWVDEYCDLTLDKLVNEYASKKDGKSIVHKVPNVVNDVKELKEQLGLLKESKDEKKDEYTYNDSFGNLGVISNTIYIHEDDSNE